MNSMSIYGASLLEPSTWASDTWRCEQALAVPGDASEVSGLLRGALNALSHAIGVLHELNGDPSSLDTSMRRAEQAAEWIATSARLQATAARQAGLAPIPFPVPLRRREGLFSWIWGNCFRAQRLPRMILELRGVRAAIAAELVACGQATRGRTQA